MRGLGDFLAQGGTIVGGGAALGASIGFIAGSVVHDFRPQTDPDEWAQVRCARRHVRPGDLRPRRHRIQGVKLRSRKYVALAVTVLVAAIYSRLANGWDDLLFYAGAAGLLVVIALVALPWMEFAPDGAFRRDPTDLT